MPTFETFAAFTLTTFIFAYMLGTALLYATRQTIARRTKLI